MTTMLFFVITYVFFLRQLFNEEATCVLPWECAPGYHKAYDGQPSLFTAYCESNTPCPDGTASWNDTCVAAQRCAQDDRVVLEGSFDTCTNATTYCIPDVNRTAGECVLFEQCKVPSRYLSATKRFDGSTCVVSGENCWDMYKRALWVCSSFVTALAL